MDKLATKLVDMALDGNIQAIKEIGDRLEGRTSQSVAIDHNSDFNITVNR